MEVVTCWQITFYAQFGVIFSVVFSPKLTHKLYLLRGCLVTHIIVLGGLLDQIAQFRFDHIHLYYYPY